MKTLAQRFAHCRELAGLTQLELAEKAGVSQTAVSKIENGETKKPKDINRFAKILRVSADFLETGEEPENVDKSFSSLSYSASELVGLIHELDKTKSIPDDVYKAIKVIVQSGFGNSDFKDQGKGLDDIDFDSK